MSFRYRLLTDESIPESPISRVIIPEYILETQAPGQRSAFSILVSIPLSIQQFSFDGKFSSNVAIWHVQTPLMLKRPQ